MKKRVIRFRRKSSSVGFGFDIVVVYCFKRSRSNFIERLGFFNPVISRELVLNFMRLGYWLNRGVILRKSVRKYLLKFVSKNFWC